MPEGEKRMAWLVILLIMLLITLVIDLSTWPMRGGWMGAMLHLQCSYPTGILEPTEHCWVRTC